MIDPVATARNEVAGIFKGRIERIERQLNAVLSGAIERNFVLTCGHGIYIRKSGHEVEGTGIENATRFSAAKGRELAPLIKNGNGERAAVMDVQLALERDLADVKAGLLQIEVCA